MPQPFNHPDNQPVVPFANAKQEAEPFQLFPGPKGWERYQPPQEIGSFLSEAPPDSFFQSESNSHERLKQDWMVVVFIAVLTILALVRRAFPKRVGQLFTAFTSNRFVNQLLREESVLANRASLTLMLVYLLTFSLFLTQTFQFFNLNLPIGNGPGLFAGISLLLAVALILKILIHSVGSVLLKVEAAMEEYLFHMVVFTNVLGLLLLPVAIIIAFSGEYAPEGIGGLMVYLGLILIGLMFLFRLVKTLYLGSTTTNFSGFYIIVYLCTLEILPLLIFFKYTGLNNW